MGLLRLFIHREKPRQKKWGLGCRVQTCGAVRNADIARQSPRILGGSLDLVSKAIDTSIGVIPTFNSYDSMSVATFFTTRVTQCHDPVGRTLALRPCKQHVCHDPTFLFQNLDPEMKELELKVRYWSGACITNLSSHSPPKS